MSQPENEKRNILGQYQWLCRNVCNNGWLSAMCERAIMLKETGSVMKSNTMSLSVIFEKLSVPGSPSGSVA
jgi:hypothetical protein